jgi:hypothetical protein
MERTAGVTPSENETEQGNDSTLEFSSTSRRKRFPNEGLANVGRFMPEPKPYPFWRSSSRRTTRRGATMSWMMRFGLAVETGEDVDGGLAEGNDECED